MSLLKRMIDTFREENRSPAEKQSSEQSDPNIHDELSPKQRLDNLLSQVKTLAQSDDYNTREAIFYIIKIYADMINRSDNAQLLESSREFDSRKNRPLTFFSPKYRYMVEQPFRIYLSKSAVITDIQKKEKEKQINALKNIGTQDDPFEERRINNRYYFFMPIGLTYLYNGNHSANSGIVRSQGYLEFNPNKINCHAYDLTPLYDELYYDGECFRYQSNAEIYEQAAFEYGCIFEIGRILAEYKISYFDYI